MRCRLDGSACAETCPFWEPGGAVLAAGCVFERTPLDLSKPGVADLLGALKRRLESPVSRDDEREARALFRLILDAAFDDSD